MHHDALQSFNEDKIYVDGRKFQAVVNYVYNENDPEDKKKKPEDRVQSPKTMCKIPIPMPLVLGSLNLTTQNAKECTILFYRKCRRSSTIAVSHWLCQLRCCDVLER